MIKRSELYEAQRRAAKMVQHTGLYLSPAEINRFEAVDFGLNRLNAEGAMILTMVQTARISVKLLVLFPHQTEPEHWHPPVGDDPGKEETVRVLWGTLHFYIDGPNTLSAGFIPPGQEAVYTMRHELVMKPSDTLTLQPGAKHWFQAGSEGAIIFSFSTVARDVLDCFTDPSVVRETVIVDD
ncbi:MAG: D-lyxose isomerase [Chloroflexota bacterium]|nr:hypothetical protein [Caldilinea sp.]GIK71753.1 MAG: D-lyxose isomerase [Chloroflexota bacterium]